MKTENERISPHQHKGVVRVQITEAKLLELLKGGLLCTSDMRCLDCESKDCLWRLTIKAGAYRMGRD